MSERSWTPGPWAIGKSKKTVRAGGIQISQSCGPGAASVGVQKANDERLIANARLIAAAPEMFELLERVIDPNDHNFNDVESRIREIIKRVKGDQ